MKAQANEKRRWLHLLLAHHQPPHLDHCYRWSVAGRPVDVCARCIGLYPAMAVTMTVVLCGAWGPGAQAAFRLMGAFCLPALLDWTVVRLGFWKGRNYLRTLTGASMGFGLGAAFPYYFAKPASVGFWLVGGALVGAAAIVEATARFFDEM